MSMKKSGGKRPGAGRKATGRVSVMLRLSPAAKRFLDERKPTPRGHIVEGLIAAMGEFA